MDEKDSVVEKETSGQDYPTITFILIASAI